MFLSNLQILALRKSYVKGSTVTQNSLINTFALRLFLLIDKLMDLWFGSGVFSLGLGFFLCFFFLKI